MTTLSIQPPFPILTDADGRPLENGYIWIGAANLNPQTNPIAVYWDAALTQPAVQPIRTQGGYPVNAGTPARLYVNSDYSIQVMNKNGALLYAALSATERYGNLITALDVTYTPGPDSLLTATTVQGALDELSDDTSGAGVVGFTQSGTNPAARTVQDKLRERITVEDFGAVGNGIVNDTVAIQNAINAAVAANQKLLFGSGKTYLVSAELQVNGNLEISTTGNEQAIIQTQTNSGIAIDAGGNSTSPAVTTTLAANLRISTDTMTVASATGIQSGMLARLRSTKAWYHDPRVESSVSPVSDGTGTAQSGSLSTIVLKSSTSFTGFAGLAVTIESGTGEGQARVVQSYNSSTKTCTMTANWTTAPDNTSVYRFAQLFKGELHLVRGVSGSSVSIDAQFGDGYDVVDDTYGDGLEAVTIDFYNPITVKIDNLYIKRPSTLDANSFGIRVIYGLNCEITRCRTEYAQATGVALSNCYNTLVERCEFNHCNDTTTGYGSQSSACFRTVYRLNRAYGCRRGIDISGTVPSYHCVVEFTTVFGGGAQEDGQLYTPAGGVANFGVGSHGTASGTVYRGNLIGNVSRGINLRGRDEIIVGNTFFGDFNVCVIDLSHGANISVLNNTYNNSFDQNGQPRQVEANSFQANNILNFQAQYFVLVQSTYEYGFTTIRDNNVRGVNRYFLFFDFTAVFDVKGFDIANNYVHILPNAGSAECALVGTDAGGKNFVSSNLNNNTVVGADSTTELRTLGVFIDIDGNGAGVNEFSGVKTLTVWMDDQTTAKMRVPYNGPNHVVFMLYCGNSVTQRFFGALGLNSVTLTSMGALNAVQGFATPPAGSDPTAGNIGVNYDGKFLNIANNVGATRTVYVTFFPIQ